MIVVAVKEGAGLLAVHRIIGGVKVQYQLIRRLWVRLIETLHQKGADLLEHRGVDPIFEPAQRRRTGQLLIPIDSGLDGWIVSQGVMIDKVFIAQRQSVNSLAHHIHHFVANL